MLTMWGRHNPLAAEAGIKGEGEWNLASHRFGLGVFFWATCGVKRSPGRQLQLNAAIREVRHNDTLVLWAAIWQVHFSFIHWMFESGLNCRPVWRGCPWGRNGRDFGSRR